MSIQGAAAAVTGTHKNELMLFYTLLELTLIVLALITTLTISDFVPGRFALRVAMVAAFSTVITTPALRYYLPRAGLNNLQA